MGTTSLGICAYLRSAYYSKRPCLALIPSFMKERRPQWVEYTDSKTLWQHRRCFKNFTAHVITADGEKDCSHLTAVSFRSYFWFNLSKTGGGYSI